MYYLSETQNQLILQGTSYLNFINAIKSPATRVSYANSLRRYMNHLRLANVDDLLLHQTSPRLIEAQLVDYIMSLRSGGVAYATIQVLIAPIFTFYQLNDVVLNRTKVHRYLGEYKRVVRDKAYSTEARSAAPKVRRDLISTHADKVEAGDKEE